MVVITQSSPIRPIWTHTQMLQILSSLVLVLENSCSQVVTAVEWRAAETAMNATATASAAQTREMLITWLRGRDRMVRECGGSWRVFKRCLLCPEQGRSLAVHAQEACQLIARHQDRQSAQDVGAEARDRNSKDCDEVESD